MKRLTYFIGLLAMLLVIISFPSNSYAEEQKSVYITQFYGEGCPHCAAEEEFLSTIDTENANVEIRYLEVYNNKTNFNILKNVSEQINEEVTGVPFLLICDEAITGYLNDDTTGEQISSIIKKYKDSGCNDVVAPFIDSTKTKPVDNSKTPDGLSNIISVPIVGEIDLKSWSLPLLTIILGGLDGFNPCAMWVLIFLISLLLGMKDRTKMWILGLAFIMSSAAVYFFFLAAWLHLILFFSFILAIRTVIGIVAIASGVYYLREFKNNKEGVCTVEDAGQKRKIINKLKEVVKQKSFVLALVGIISIAAAVNIVELACSAGLPAVFTQILSTYDLSIFQYYSYLLLYIFVFMLDDMIVFAIAMIMMDQFSFNTKYSRWSNLIGGIIMLILGLLLIFKPELMLSLGA